jgi:hypothetical protein
VNGIERKFWNSGARLDATTLVLMTEAANLQAMLGPVGVELTPFPGAPSGQHPVCIDLWQVEDGRLESAGVDQHAWSATTGAATAAASGGWLGAAAGAGLGAFGGAAAGGLMGTSFGPVGWALGTFGGWIAGSAWGGAAGAAVGAARGASLGAGVARGLSEAMSRTLGTYREALVAVPNAVRSNGQGDPHMLVLGMYSDGPVSIWGDRVQRCGYRKCLATISCDGFQRYEIRQGERPASLSAVFASARAEAWGPADARLGTYRALFAQPLLGHLDDGTFAVTFLDRFPEAPEVCWAPVSGRLSIASDFIAGVPPGEFDLEELSAEHPWGAFQAASIPVKVTRPHHY